MDISPLYVCQSLNEYQITICMTEPVMYIRLYNCQRIQAMVSVIGYLVLLRMCVDDLADYENLCV